MRRELSILFIDHTVYKQYTALGELHLKESVFGREAGLLEAALEEFSEKSYEDASLNAILRGAGISKGVFYYHFADKKALYLFLQKASAEAKWKFIDENASLQGAACGDIFEQFRRQARLAAEFAAQYPRFHRLGEMLAKERGNPVYEEAMKALGGSAESVIAPMVDQAVREGNLKKEYSREFLIRLLSYLFGHFHEIFDREEERGLESVLANLDTYIDFIRHGVGNE
ncbi:TetR/AcrR family transcriptional regulator [Papillibacter cinnamivorans]|uniref:Transcriptional regulator, TetR family n=1 Tax=Papillibacter cinnamivorans DSM 12816 TaxID=1122930 RepID=A0A1W2CNW9_9FIRM|nr:TetR/AcrR family transcriptional regulator [Papillibacter cinnamivorans]SMC86937.1 transcriptional regulator, TetR family [Papillibacter cinnamivorans DSM 12816]